MRRDRRRWTARGAWRGRSWRSLRLPMVAAFVLTGLLAIGAAHRGEIVAWWDGAPPRLGVIHGPAGSAPAAGSAARVAVVDGDSLAAGGRRLRLHGIDAPEIGQACTRGGRPYDCGREASDAMARIIGRSVLACRVLGTDQFGREIVRCHDSRGLDVAGELVRQGWAIAFRRFSDEYVGQEAEARAARRGLWAGSFEEPSDWRRRHR